MPVPGQVHNGFHSYSSCSLFILSGFFLDDGLLPSLRTIDLVFSNFVITINSCARS